MGSRKALKTKSKNSLLYTEPGCVQPAPVDRKVRPHHFLQLEVFRPSCKARQSRCRRAYVQELGSIVVQYPHYILSRQFECFLEVLPHGQNKKKDSGESNNVLLGHILPINPIPNEQYPVSCLAHTTKHLSERLFL